MPHLRHRASLILQASKMATLVSTAPKIDKMPQPGGGITPAAFLAAGVCVSIAVFWLARFFSSVCGICTWLDDYPATRSTTTPDGHIARGTLQSGLALASGAMIWLVHPLRNLHYNAGYVRAMLLLILVPGMSFCNGCPSSSFDHTVNSEGALEFPLFHTDHLCVQQHVGRTMSTNSIVEADLPIDLIRNDSINNDLFLMPIKLGTPPVWNLVSIDTGSPLCFVQCEPCTLNCHDQEGAGPIFSPNGSQSFRRVGCSEPVCHRVQSALHIQSKACMEIEDTCLYSATYRRGSYYSVGKLVTDTIAIGRDDKGHSVPSFIFGCSLDTEYDQHEAGIFGFGASPFSFFEQVAPMVGYKAFSYCFPSDVNKTGYLSIGDYNRVSSTSYTPLFLSRQRSQYALKLDQVVVDGIMMATNHSDMVVDSGSKWTSLSSATFSQLDMVITRAMEPLQYSRTDRRGADYICFEDLVQFKQLINWSTLPVVELSFATGATLTLPPRSTFHFHKEFGLCTYFTRDDAGVQVLGNMMTRSVGVTYDIQGGRFAFRNDDC